MSAWKPSQLILAGSVLGVAYAIFQFANTAAVSEHSEPANSIAAAPVAAANTAGTTPEESPVEAESRGAQVGLYAAVTDGFGENVEITWMTEWPDPKSPEWRAIRRSHRDVFEAMKADLDAVVVDPEFNGGTALNYGELLALQAQQMEQIASDRENNLRYVSLGGEQLGLTVGDIRRLHAEQSLANDSDPGRFSEPFELDLSGQTLSGKSVSEIRALHARQLAPSDAPAATVEQYYLVPLTPEEGLITVDQVRAMQAQQLAQD